MSKYDDISDTRFKFIRISNFDRDESSDSSGNFTVHLNTPDLMQCKNFWVHMVSLPHVFPNIYDGINVLQFNYDNGGGPASGTVTITPGQYTTSQILTEMKTQIDAIITPGTITFTQNANTSLVSFTTTGMTSINLLSEVDDPTSTLAFYIGLTASTGNVTAATFPDAPALQGVKMIYLHSKDIIPSQTQITFNQGRPVSSFCSIPVKVNYRDQIIYESRGSHVDRSVFHHEKPMNTLHIILRAQDGRILEVGDNQEIVIVLKAFF